MTPRTKHPIEGRSNGYEAVAAEYMSRRVKRNVGVATVQRWTRSLPHGGAVVDLGCGHGLPLSMTLLDEGLAVHGIDASPSMVAAFRHRDPRAPVICEPAETSDFFGRTFDGALAWGLVFLLDEAAQRQLIRRVAQALKPGGRFLFTSPARRAPGVTR